jgi:urease alpha subunit
MAVEQMKNIYFASEGDKVLLTNGSIYEFVKVKRTKFIATKDSKFYDIPISAFQEIIEKAPPKKINQGYKKLKVNDLFIIDVKDNACLFSFVEISNGRIVGINPLNNMRTRIDIGLYVGTLNEVKKGIKECQL